jgi:hypothetical protein
MYVVRASVVPFRDRSEYKPPPPVIPNENRSGSTRQRSAKYREDGKGSVVHVSRCWKAKFGSSFDHIDAGANFDVHRHRWPTRSIGSFDLPIISLVLFFYNDLIFNSAEEFQ